ncbi:MAG: polysaccharide deacetylase family protein [Campylobacterota bacterium]|nr:polysaccharide deacetylase family protein [Campylobacterota bacterium]
MRKFLFLALLPLLLWGDAHIFVYHRFGDPKHASTNTSIEVLRAEFEYFKKHGYEVISLKQLSDAFKQGKPIKENWVVLTIDDSYKSFYNNGLPLFKEYGYPFTLFIYIEAIDKKYNDFMTWEQIRETKKYGEIGLHSYGHHHMVSMTPEAIRKDTQKGFDSFFDHLGEKPKYYAYPFGEYDQKVRTEIESFGFDLIINQNSGAVDHQSDPNDLDRTALTGENLVAQKLRIKTLPTTWISPKGWPENGKLKSIHATIPPDIKHLEYYLSGHGWQRTKAENGIVNTDVNLSLKFKRSRLFLKHGHQQSSIILVKE